MTFSATEAAFEGFRVVRRKPMALVFWALAYIAMMALSFAVAGGSIAALMAAVENMKGAGEPAPEDLAAIGRLYASMFSFVLPVALIFGAVLSAAVARAVVRPAESAFGYLRLGMDELRVLAVSIVLGLLFALVAMAVALVLGVVIGFSARAEIPALWLVVVLAVLAAVVLVIWLAVRFSLAVPITVAERRVAIFDSFRLTKGRGWPLLGMAVIAGVMSIIVSLLGSLVFLPLSLTVGGIENLAEMDGSNTMEILQAAWPAVLGWIVIQSVLSALQLAVLYAPFAAAYRDIKAG